eukprot:scaffold103810_cov63-Phaeocystis_antarctica.AAC.4
MERAPMKPGEASIVHKLKNWPRAVDKCADDLSRSFERCFGALPTTGKRQPWPPAMIVAASCTGTAKALQQAPAAASAWPIVRPYRSQRPEGCASGDVFGCCQRMARSRSPESDART